MSNNYQRCEWINGKPEYYIYYHDHVWGKPEHDDRKLFRWLILEIFHVGLSWQLVLSKQEAFDKAFDHFDVEKIVQYDETKVLALLADESIIRHRKKIESAIVNAKMFLEIQKIYGSFDAYIWNFTQGKTIVRQDNTHHTKSLLSDQVAKDLKRRGFKFIGSVTIYSYLQAIGIINDHELHCEFR